jgi:hypothetical protein
MYEWERVEREQRLAEIRESVENRPPLNTLAYYGYASRYFDEIPYLLAEVERLTAERDALRQACEVGYKEMERITGDRGFEPQRFRQRMNALLALGAVLGEATDGK